MKRNAPHAWLVLLFGLSLLIGGCEDGRTRLVLGGGPAGRTFQSIASGLAELINRNLPEVRVKVQPSGGSVANLIDVDQGKMDLALVYAADAYLGKEGVLPIRRPATQNVRALARLFGEAAHLIVPRDSLIQTPRDLKTKRVAIGSSGSGSALSARRFFKSLSIWEEVVPIYVDFALGMEELNRGSVEAVWVLMGYPSPQLQELTYRRHLRFIDLFDAAVVSGFFQSYPFYAVARIPADTYNGQERDVVTFQDAALLVADPQMDENLVYAILKLLFSKEGVARMLSAHPVAWDLDVEKGLMGVKIPLHPGAARFWREREGRVL